MGGSASTSSRSVLTPTTLAIYCSQFQPKVVWLQLVACRFAFLLFSKALMCCDGYKTECGKRGRTHSYYFGVDLMSKKFIYWAFLHTHTLIFFPFLFILNFPFNVCNVIDSLDSRMNGSRKKTSGQILFFLFMPPTTQNHPLGVSTVGLLSGWWWCNNSFYLWLARV